jgi:hypothetical protein
LADFARSDAAAASALKEINISLFALAKILVFAGTYLLEEVVVGFFFSFPRFFFFFSASMRSCANGPFALRSGPPTTLSHEDHSKRSSKTAKIGEKCNQCRKIDILGLCCLVELFCAFQDPNCG